MALMDKIFQRKASIFHCKHCGHIELMSVAHKANVVCTQCQREGVAYDCVFFVRKLIERYTALAHQYRALQETKKNETQTTNNESILYQPSKQSNSIAQESPNLQHLQTNLLHNVNFKETDILSSREQHKMLEDWFAARDIQLQFDYSAVDTSGFFDDASLLLGQYYPLCKTILNSAKWAYHNKRPSFNIDLGKYTQQEAKSLRELCQNLYNYSIFTRYIYRKENKVAQLFLQNTQVIQQFLTGGWLEWYVLMKLLERAKSRGQHFVFSCSRSTKFVFRNQDVHELDVLFMTQHKLPVVIECKSGEFRQDIPKLVNIQKRLGLPVENFIVLALDNDQQQANALSKMYPLTFASLNDWQEKVSRLL